MDMDTYVPTERVRAGQVLKPTEIVTSDGKFTAARYSYIVERTRLNELGQEYQTSEIMDKEEFNSRYKRLDWRDEDRKEARQEGYNDGYDDGWNAAVTAKATADKVVTEEDSDDALPPVGDRLETDGPVSTRPEPDTLDSSHDADRDDSSPGATARGPASGGEGEASGSDVGGSEPTGVQDAHAR